MYSTKTVSSQTTSPWIPLDDNQAAFSATVAVAVSGTLTYTVEFTLDNIQDPAVTPVAFPIGLVGETTSNTTFIKSPVKAVRLNVTAFTSGSATIGARQGTDNVWSYPDSTDFAEAFSTTPKTVMSVGTPFAILPGDLAATGLQFSGTAGNFSLSGVVLSNIWTALRGCWCYFPANFGGSSYPGGWYWTVFSSDTAGIVYTNTYTSGIPSDPGTPTAFPVNLNGRINQTIAEVTGPTGIIIPGGSIGKNGTIKTHWRIGGNINGTKYYRTYLDAVAVGLLSSTTSPMYEALTSICNQGDESRQLLSHTNSLPGVGTGFTTLNANSMSSIDTSVDKTLSLSLQLSVNTAAAILLHADVSVTYGA